MNRIAKLLLVVGFGIGLMEGVIVPETVGSGGVATSWTLTLDEGKNYWIAPPQFPDPVQNITDAASLEQEMRGQIDPSLSLEAARYLPFVRPAFGGFEAAYECYPKGSTLDPPPGDPAGFCWSTTDDLSWDAREGLHVRFSTPGGNASGDFTWDGVEVAQTQYGISGGGVSLFAPQGSPSVPPFASTAKGLLIATNSFMVTKLFPRTDTFQTYTFASPDFPLVPGEAYRLGHGSTSRFTGTVERSTSVGAGPGLAGRRIRIQGSSQFVAFTDHAGSFEFEAKQPTESESVLSVIDRDGEQFAGTSTDNDVTCGGSSCTVDTSFAFAGMTFTRDAVPEDIGVEIYPRYAEGAGGACTGDVIELCTRYRNLGDQSLATAEVRLQLPAPELATWLKYNTTTEACTFPPSNLAAGPDAGNVLAWDIAGIAPDEQCTVCAKVKLTAPPGANLTATASGYVDFPIQDPVTVPDSLNDAIWNGSVDCRPSTGDALVEPGCGELGAIAASDTLRVLVRFDNPTAAPVVDVDVRQVLSRDMWLTKLRVVDTSHSLTEVATNPFGVIQFIFDDINLQPGAAGYVVYETALLPSTTVGTTVSTAANTFFSPGGAAGEVAQITNEVFSTVFDDADSDSLLDPCDNCPGTFNPGQGDIDGDGLGDACDPDLDGDGFDNGVDTCPQGFNPGQGAVGFGQSIFAAGRGSFFWPQPVDVVFGRGSLSQLKFFPDFVILASSQGTSFVNDSASPSSGNGFYYLARLGFNCSLSSWQTEPLGSQAPRDAFLP